MYDIGGASDSPVTAFVTIPVTRIVTSDDVARGVKKKYSYYQNGNYDRILPKYCLTI